jgi:hypothetical protein
MVDIILTEGERRIMDNLHRKRQQAEQMFGHLVAEMNHSLNIERKQYNNSPVELPSWL